jgi:hypothetical protein
MITNPNETDRVRRHTSPELLARIDAQIEENVRCYSTFSRDQLTGRLRELEQEWGMERYLEANASAIGLTSVALGMTVSRKWLLLTGTVMGFLLQHAVQGWCPPIPIFRRLGVRTRGEIDREIYALKALRGDFKHIQPVQDNSAAVDQAMRAVAKE